MFSVLPIPESDEEAWDEFDEREEKNEDSEKEPHHQLKELIEKLTAKYPCISTLPDEKIDDGVWADGPLSNNIVGDLAVLAIVFSKVDEALPFIKKTTKELGLVFYDPQEESIIRP